LRSPIFKRPANLQTLFEALLTVQPISVEAERALNACGRTLVSFPQLMHWYSVT